MKQFMKQCFKENFLNRVLAVVLALVCVVAMIPQGKWIVQAEIICQPAPELVSNGASNNLYVKGSQETTQSGYDVVKWHYRSEDGKYYLYLPSSTDLNKLTVWHTFSGNISVNGTVVQNGETTDVFKNAGKFTLKAGNSSYSLVVMKSENINTLFIGTDSGSLDQVNECKSNTDKGTVVYVNTTGKTEEIGLDQIKGRGNSSWEAAQKLFYK
ncbi:MAG: hypothetical protein II073_07170, partial [Lachnospiraceae bacterium]|nr:hypothetical protein [Lachnospiraceae bacterium]